MLQYYNFFHLVLWNDIYSNSTTKEEKTCEKLLCCFMLPVGTIALAGISTWQNPLISPHKTTSYIPQGYYSNWVTLISLYIVLLPLQSCLIFCIALHFSAASLTVKCVWETPLSVSACLLFMPTCYALIRTIVGREKKNLSHQNSRIGCFRHHGLNQVVGGFPPTRCLFVHPSVRLWIMWTVKRPNFNKQEAPLVCNLCKWYSMFTNRLDM